MNWLFEKEMAKTEKEAEDMFNCMTENNIINHVCRDHVQFKRNTLLFFRFQQDDKNRGHTDCKVTEEGVKENLWSQFLNRGLDDKELSQQGLKKLLNEAGADFGKDVPVD